MARLRRREEDVHRDEEVTVEILEMKKPNKRPEPMAVLRTAIGSSLNVGQKEE